VTIDLPIVLRTLRKRHSPPRTFLQFRTPLDLLVATILSAQCTDVRVNAVTQNILYPKYRTAKDYASVSQKELEKDIHSCGTFRNKARHIRQMCNLLIKDHGGAVPETLDALVQLPGVGRKTACVVLWAAFGKTEGVAVDTHVQRVARRLGLSTGTTPERIEKDLMRKASRKDWGVLTTLLISHGRATCTARKRQCDVCPFKKACPSSWVTQKKDRTSQDKRNCP
jgi:endonuclease III